MLIFDFDKDLVVYNIQCSFGLRHCHAERNQQDCNQHSKIANAPPKTYLNIYTSSGNDLKRISCDALHQDESEKTREIQRLVPRHFGTEAEGWGG